ncbi:MAG: hypothetical protein M1822_000147 [Bathelium mastoideum]|nr:MAG: hypothetical protein M1822_000147 [Bathelium mastoideum]
MHEKISGPVPAVIPSGGNSSDCDPNSRSPPPSALKRNAIDVVSLSPSGHVAQETPTEGIADITPTRAPNADPRKRGSTPPIASGNPGLDGDGRRPQRLRSRTSWLSGRGKSYQKSLDPFPYQFDPFSDSDLSSSSSDESHGLENCAPAQHEKRERDASSSKKQDDYVQRGSVSEQYRKFNIANKHFRTKGKVSKRDGRLKITVNETLNSGFLARALGASIRHHLDLPGSRKHASGQHRDPARSLTIEQSGQTPLEDGVISSLVSNTIRGPYLTEEDLSSPKLNVVIIVIGSRGDIQPFLKIGKTLREQHGHRVRVATHPAFKKFVEEDSGLEFFSVGGDPSELMAFMVKNPGLIPSLDTVRQGEIGRRRKAMYEMFEGMWRACIQATDAHDKDDRKRTENGPPFIADAIIANPPSFAHVHIAERLGVPLHMIFTFPYSPTAAFPHPLANIRKGNVDANYTNFMSYPLVELMTWQGLGDLANKFRTETLGLDPVSTVWAPGQLYRFKVPYTYLWSPSLVPKPSDWGPEIDIGGFVFLEMADSFDPPKELTDFLNAGEPPVYIGFGSIVVDDPEVFTRMIFEAVSQAGVRALVSKGWGGIGGEGDDVPEHIFMLGNTPHDWLFPKCAAVVHHGGAGTTAIGLKCAKPTMIVPFFGDQSFWGSMVARAGAGAKKCVPFKKLTAEKLAEGIRECLTEEARQNVRKMADGIAQEGDGAMNAVKSFQRHLPVGRQGQEADMRCEILPDQVAVWQLKDKKRKIKLSALAVDILVEKQNLKWKHLRLARHLEWNDFGGPGEPITGVGAAISGTVTGLAGGVSSLPVGVAKTVKARGKREKKKRKLEKRKERSEQQMRDHLQGGSKVENNETNVADSYEGVTATDQQQAAEAKERSQAESSQLSNLIPDISAEQAIRADLNRSDSHQQNISQPSQATSPPSNEMHAPHISIRRHPLNRNSTLSSTLSAEPFEALPTEIAGLTGRSALQTASAVAALPFDLSLAVAQGFHNAPRLYGDETVRRPPRITGWRSGMRAARLEFGYGIRDGWTGLVTQPRRGLKKGLSGEGVGLGDKALGGLEGFGKGLGGLVLKDVSAVVGPLAFIAQGLRKEATKGRQLTAQLRQGRMEEGRRRRREENERVKTGSKRNVEVVGSLEKEVMNAWILKGDMGMSEKNVKKVENGMEKKTSNESQ